MKMQVINQNGKRESEIDLPESMLNKHYNFDLVHQFVSTYVHNSHQSTKGQKNRSAVRGGGRKPWKQKGTGRARAGTIRSPIWRSGGVTFAHVFKPSKKKLNKNSEAKDRMLLVHQYLGKSNHWKQRFKTLNLN